MIRNSAKIKPQVLLMIIGFIIIIKLSHLLVNFDER